MYKDIKKKWVNALRSGEHSQTQGNLKDDTGYCCLGVLCDIYSKESGEVWQPTIAPDEKIIYEIHNSYGTLPTAITNWAGTNSDSPYVKIKIIDPKGNTEKINVSLDQLNDDYHYNFSQIADIIEAQL